MRGIITATGMALLPVVTYIGNCAIRPFRDCWLCTGHGYRRSVIGSKPSRPCRWCQATGKRLRIGRRAWNRARRTARDAD